MAMGKVLCSQADLGPDFTRYRGLNASPPQDIKGTQIELTPNQAGALNNTNALKGCLRMICD